MAKRLIHTERTEHYELKVYHDKDWGEFNSKVFRIDAPKRLCVSSYHAGDKQDAMGSGRAELANSEKYSVMAPAIE